MGPSLRQEEEKPVGLSPGHDRGSRGGDVGGEEEEKPVGPSPGHDRGSRGGEEEEQTSGSKSGTGGGATSVSESGASLWQPGRRGGGAKQWG